jgi:hypothetical protein
MIKQKTTLEIEKEKRRYTFECEPDSPLGEIYDVLTQMKAYVTQTILDLEAKSKSEQEAPAKEE